MAGGRALTTPFGTFYAPNITPDRATGIGSWSVADVVRALREGRRPDGQPYYPAFPYPAYTGLTEADARAIATWLLAQPPVAQATPDHELPWYLQTRWVMLAWNFLNFTPGTFVPEPARQESWNRGAYLVRHLGHCGECHTPRTLLGGLDRTRELAGTEAGPEDAVVPNITPHPDTGIGNWSAGELELFLEIGMSPDGDFAGASMGTVISDNTSRLTPGDRAAITAYLQSVPAR
jgi:mono/diheme cytochrome c family protein